MARLIVCMTGISIAGREKYEPAESFGRRVRQRLRDEKASSSSGFYTQASAEINVLNKIGCGGDDTVLFLSSETADGKTCAELLRETVKREFGSEGEVQIVPGLQMTDAARFRRDGIRNLFQKLRQAQAKAQSLGLELVLNLNGGFKSVLPFAALYGMIQQRPAFYSYERTETLIKLPALPLAFDWDRLGFAAEALTALGQKKIMEAREFEALLPNHGWGDDPLFEVLIEREDGFVCPTVAGDLMFERLAFETIGSQVLLSPRAWRKTKGDDVNPLVMKALENIRDPLQRAMPGHCERYRGKTNMLIWKTRGNSAPRLFYWVSRNAVFIADILRHDEYDDEMEHGKGCWREDFSEEEFRQP
jgi:putative CRISPR-associated protein (TIGR02619 family)